MRNWQTVHFTCSTVILVVATIDIDNILNGHSIVNYPIRFIFLRFLNVIRQKQKSLATKQSVKSA